MIKKISIILFFLAGVVGARHAVPLQGLPLLFDTAFAATQENGQPCPPECVTDSMEIITYYPSPYGYYEELRGDKIIVGDSDNSWVNETDLPPTGTITFDGLPSAPTGNLYESTMYYDTSEHKFKYYYNSDWKDLGGGGTYWDILTGNDIHNTNSGNIKTSGNMGIGLGISDTIGASLHIFSGDTTKGLIVQQKDGIGSGVDETLRRIYTSSGYQTYTVPEGVPKIIISVFGAKGGGSLGGLGGGARATFIVNPGEVLNLYVGGSDGFNTDSANPGQPSSNGGGASDVRRGGTGLNDRIIVAGGGGASGKDKGSGFEFCIHPECNAGGAGGGSAAQDGAGCGGGGATDNSGGAGGNCEVVYGANFGDGCCLAGPGDAGGLGIAGGHGSGGGGRSSCITDGGSGGGGYYGGGGGGGGGLGCGGGGGGGSSWIKNTGENTSMSIGVNSGNGQIIIDAIKGIATTSLIEWRSEDGTTLGIIDRIGNLALGSSSANGYKLYVNGSAYVTSGAWTASDLRFKKNILPLDNSLDKILNIQPVSFDWNKIGYPQMNFEQNRQIGLVAQEVEKQIPELVRTDSDGYKSIAYDKLTVVTIEAIKEQQKEIEELKAMLKETSRKQQKEIELLKAGKD